MYFKSLGIYMTSIAGNYYPYNIVKHSPKSDGKASDLDHFIPKYVDQSLPG